MPELNLSDEERAELNRPGRLAADAGQIGYLSGILTHRDGGRAFIHDPRFLTPELVKAMRTSCVKQAYQQALVGHGHGHDIFQVEAFANTVLAWQTALPDSDEAHFFREVQEVEEHFGLTFSIGLAIIGWHLVNFGAEFYADPTFMAPPIPVKRSAAGVVRYGMLREILMIADALVTANQFITANGLFFTDELNDALRLPLMRQTYALRREKFKEQAHDEDGFIVEFINLILEWEKGELLAPDLVVFLAALRNSNTACDVPHEMGIGLVAAYLFHKGDELYAPPKP